MSRFFYPRLAWDGLRKNRRLAVPYLLTCICMVAVFYIMGFLASPGNPPSELPYATRWIARTEQEDAMGMCLPATCEHKGRIFCQKHRQQRYLAPGKTFTLHVETGIL